MEDNLMDETPVKTSLWNKNANDLTLKESVEATLVITAGMFVLMGAVSAVPAVASAVRDKFRARRDAKRAAQDESPTDEI